MYWRRSALTPGRARRLAWGLALLLAVPGLAPPEPDGTAGAASRSAPTFRYGMFEDANYVRGPADFAATVADLQARQFDSVLFTNNFTFRDEPLLGVADALGFGVVFAPHAELSAAWWAPDAPVSPEQARRVIYPIVDHVRDHPSLIGYNVLDDAPDRLAPKVSLAVQAFKERDPERPAAPVLVEGHDEVARAAETDVRLTYVYPALVVRPPCDFSLTAGRGPDAFSEHLRHVASFGPAQTPLWVVLQAHGQGGDYDPTAADQTALREPTPEEVRLQHWLALGEGAKGIFWFIYTTQQFWTGLRDNPRLYAEISDLARRTAPLRPILGGLEKAPDRATVAATNEQPPPFRPYASTLVDGAGRVYVVAANRSCAPQQVAVDVPDARGALRDVETGTSYPLGTTFSLRGGDGRLFEVVAGG